ncbi:MAG: ROK family protein [Candidatus Cloacimonetes bacterium]|nr:ROK family protein [Candidatus Cloacimonadota bacterium]
MTFVGIDIGGSSIKYGTGTAARGIEHFSSLALDAKELKKPGALNYFRDRFARIFADLSALIPLEKIAAIGIGTPGMIDQAEKKIRGVNPNLRFWTDLNPAIVIPHKISQPLFFDNDANLMALAEASFYPPGLHILGLTLGSGIGSGFIIDHQVYHGARGFAMELGHLCVVSNGKLCNCGKRGCLEAYASLNGIQNRMTELGIDHQNPGLASILSLGASDQRIKRLIFRGLKYLSIALANSVILLNPDLIILGGGGAELGIYPPEKLLEGIRKLLPTPHTEHLKIGNARLGNKAGVFGAILLAESELGK